MILTITIPDEIKCLLKIGQKVDFNTPFLENKIISEQTISISNKLHILPSKIFKYLKKFVGDHIQKGDVIAEKKGLININVVVSEYAGVIKEIDHYDGSIVISALTAKDSQTKAFFKGEVEAIEKSKLKLKVVEAQEFKLKLATENFGGQAFYFVDPNKAIFAPQTSNKIMVSEIISSYLKAKSEALGIEGFVSLKNPPPESNLPKAQIKNIEDFKKILYLNFPYCLIDKQYCKIYFYR